MGVQNPVRFSGSFWGLMVGFWSVFGGCVGCLGRVGVEGPGFMVGVGLGLGDGCDVLVCLV